MEKIMHYKIIAVFFSLSLISGCGPSAEEKEKISYGNGYSYGYQYGYKKALKCVDREGGEAEDAADDCKRRM